MGWDKVGGVGRKACGIPHAYEYVLLLWEGSRNPQGCRVVRFFYFCALRPYACACEYVRVSMQGPRLFLAFYLLHNKERYEGEDRKGKRKREGRKGEREKSAKLENHLIFLV